MSKPPVSDSARFRDNPTAIAEYLAEAFKSKDLGAIVLAINTVMRAQNVQQLAAAAGLRRDVLYKTFGGDVNPQLGRVMELFAGMDIELTVKASPPRPKPPRPKLGRPLSSSKRKSPGEKPSKGTRRQS
jgi:probable addiction module antidote protein